MSRNKQILNCSVASLGLVERLVSDLEDRPSKASDFRGEKPLEDFGFARKNETE
jgi:hypothetical protein